MSAGRVGVIFVELDLDRSRFIGAQKAVYDDAVSTSLKIEQNYKSLGIKSAAYFDVLQQRASNAYTMIANKFLESTASQVRAHAAMVAQINATRIDMTQNSLFDSLGVKSQANIEAQKSAIVSSYNTLIATTHRTATDLINLEAAKNAKLTALDNELNAVAIANDKIRVESAMAEQQRLGAYLAGETELRIAKHKAENEAYIMADKMAIDARIALNQRLKSEAASRVTAANAITQTNTSDWQMIGAGRSTESIKAEQLAVEAAYLRQKELAQGNASDLIAIEQGKTSKMLALNKELHAAQLKQIQDVKNEQLSAQQKLGASMAGDYERRIASEKSAADASKAQWDSLGIRSTSAIKAEMDMVRNSALEKKALYARGSQDYINISRAETDKIKSLHKEMVGSHDMSMAAMTRSVLRFYAAWYVASTAVGAVKNLFMGGVEAIDQMKMSAVTMAATITSMQGSTGNITERYKENLKYSTAMVPVLEQIDALSFANLSQIDKMNRAMTMQGVVLNANKKTQIESFTALTNAVAMFTVGQDKEKQASQEIRALFSVVFGGFVGFL